MGFAVTLIATPAGQRDALLGTARATVTGTNDAELSSPVSAGLVGDHFVIWRNMRAFKGYDLPDGRALSRGGADVLVLHVVDTAGAQELGFYRDGQEVWTVTYSEQNPDFLASTGTPPHDPQAIVAELQAADDQADDDVDATVYYGGEVPGLIFQRIVGANHETIDADGFCALSGDLPLTGAQITPMPAPSSRKPWWKFW
ncbi:hypothetical protein [Actibacterium sp. XHP0104]|uniref:hypothetical protein n=1 Tax=Actibacterium sp. XHP0104 TaxID=2984335 RepID=UPI0021E83FF7|nr:hypothetical protein [Actibacterium sp. XHP0104]MCV2880618.1 hypothetical protein [Actibacterium sp. XHP0104]